MARWLSTPVAELWPKASTAELETISRWVDKAERLIAQRFSTIDQRIRDGALDPEVIADVVEAMVSRALQASSRGGVSKLSYPEVTAEYESGAAGSGTLLYLTVDELMLLSPQRSSGAFTIRRKPEPRLPW